MTYDILSRATRARRKRRLRVLTLMAGVTALLIAGYVLTTGSADSTPAVPSPTAPAALPTSSPATAGTTGQPDPGTSAPLPGDLTSTQVAGVSVPVSPTEGPLHTQSGMARGFAHDRAGAVLAVVNLLPRLTPQVGPAVFGPTLHDQVSGPNAAAMTEQVNAGYQQLCTQAGVTPGGPIGTLSATFVGYQVQLYSDDTALLTVLTEAQQPGAAPLYAASVIQLAWVRGDWTLVAPTGGVWDQSISRVDAADIGAFNPFTAGR